MIRRTLLSVFACSLLALTGPLVPGAAAQDVLLAVAQNSTYSDDEVAKIVATGLVSGAVDVFNLSAGTPCLAYLLNYDAVFFITDGGPVDPVAWGDNLADFVDAGGGVVVGTFAHAFGITGRWLADGYNPMTVGSFTSGTLRTLGTVHDGAHPIMAGVATFSGGSASYHCTGALVTGATLIADWSHGAPLVFELPGFAGKIVGLNFYPASSGTGRTDFWDETTDGDLMMANALAYVAGNPTPMAAPSLTGVVGQDLLVSVNNAGASGNLHYRAGGTTAFTTIAMAPGATDPTALEATIPGADVTAHGLQYYLELTGCSDLILPAGAPTTEFGRVQVNRTATLTLPANTHVLGALSMQPPSSAPEAVFSALGPYDPSQWRYGTFTPAAGTYAEPPNARNVTPGQGFWAIAKETATVTVTGRSTGLSSDVTVSLGVGFNQIANPYGFPLPTANLVLSAGVERNLISWTGTGYLAGNATLSPNTGYWIKNNGPGNQTITFPIDPTPPPAPVAPVAFPGMLREETPGWSVHVTTQAGRFSDRDNRFGVRPDATDHKDDFDFSDPPAPPSGYASVSLVGEQELRLLSDYKPQRGEGLSWELVFSSDQTGEPYRVDFTTERELPAGWVLRAVTPTGLDEIVLEDDGALTGHVGVAPFERTWTILAGTQDYVESARDELQRAATGFSFSAPFPNPAVAPSFDLALARSTQVLVQAFDVRGRLVKTLADAPYDAGFHRIAWDGRNEAGTRASAGVYFVKVRAGSFAAEQKVVLVR